MHYQECPILDIHISISNFPRPARSPGLVIPEQKDRMKAEIAKTLKYNIKIGDIVKLRRISVAYFEFSLMSPFLGIERASATTMTLVAPAFFSTLAHSYTVAPVVMTSSTRISLRPVKGLPVENAFLTF